MPIKPKEIETRGLAFRLLRLLQDTEQLCPLAQRVVRKKTNLSLPAKIVAGNEMNRGSNLIISVNYDAFCALTLEEASCVVEHPGLHGLDCKYVGFLN